MRYPRLFEWVVVFSVVGVLIGIFLINIHRMESDIALNRMQHVERSVRTAMVLAHAKCQVTTYSRCLQQESPSTYITVEEQNIAMDRGWPAPKVDGIVLISGVEPRFINIDYIKDTVLFYYLNNTTPQCSVVYQYGKNMTAPEIKVNLNAC